jgi:tRNA 2-selenouridine synthase
MQPRQNPLDELAQYDEIIDVRSPAEFAEDHIPGAMNCPVLDDAQRIEVGTLYKQVSPFEAKKIGAALISENIARHLRERFLDRPKNWKPLIYCWRGGDRSGAMTTVFRSIGWRVTQLPGGYKHYRQQVVSTLDELPAQFTFIVVYGPTGSAKTRILQAIAAEGEQVLDLESLASHKGSVLGVLPDEKQPSQKWFETLLLENLQRFSASRPVYVEAESRKIGNLHLPQALIEKIRASSCVEIRAALPARVDFLLEDYAYFLNRQEFLKKRLNILHGLQSNETLKHWQELIDAGAWRELVEELLELHYDPLYQRSHDRSYANSPGSQPFSSDDLSPAGIRQLASLIIQSRQAQIA